MSHRVASDHASVDTVRGTLARQGGTHRLRIVFPAETAERFPTGETIRFVIDGHTRHAHVDLDIEGCPEIRGAYDTPRFAREQEGPNRLAEWIDATGLTLGRAVLVDVIVDDVQYGLREPGERAVYTAVDPPSNDLTDIAADLVGDDTATDQFE
ncbi:MAG: hypothetical protein ABEH65_05450 [Halobacteriales archaeon]